MDRIALALLRGRGAQTDIPRDPTCQDTDRDYVFDDEFDPVWDESLLGAAADSRVPEFLTLAREVHRRRGEYDAVLTWGERLTFGLAALQRFSGETPPHIAMIGQFAKPNTQVPMRLFGRDLHAIITWTSVQHRYAVERLGFPAERLFLVRHFVDQLFYRPQAGANDIICSVGAEMRDYPTLIEAMRGLDVACHVAADHVRIPGRTRALRDRRIPVQQLSVPPDARVTFGRRTKPELRDLYARSRFVVVPLVPSDSDNGVTVILEAMAMGKAVICSGTRGQVDVIRHGDTGLYVPVGDPVALRAAIESLWNDPERAAAMGRRARAHVEKFHTIEQFAAGVRSAVDATLAGRPAPSSWWDGAASHTEPDVLAPSESTPHPSGR